MENISLDETCGLLKASTVPYCLCYKGAGDGQISDPFRVPEVSDGVLCGLLCLITGAYEGWHMVEQLKYAC